MTTEKVADTIYQHLLLPYNAKALIIVKILLRDYIDKPPPEEIILA